MKKPTKKRLVKILDNLATFLLIFGCLTLGSLLLFAPVIQILSYYIVLVAALVMILLAISYELFTAQVNER